MIPWLFSNCFIIIVCYKLRSTYSGSTCFTLIIIINNWFFGWKYISCEVHQTETSRIKATRAHTNSIMALTIGTVATLHKSPLQQWSLHSTGGSDDLQDSCALHLDFALQPLEKCWVSFFSILTFTQWSSSPGQVTSLVAQCSQLLVL